MDDAIKPVSFIGSSLQDLRDLPEWARRSLGYQIDRLQRGLDPDDWKPMPAIGSGVREIRIRDVDGSYRAIYVAKFSEAIFVLHCFQKKTRETGRNDIGLAERRYRELLREMPS